MMFLTLSLRERSLNFRLSRFRELNSAYFEDWKSDINCKFNRVWKNPGVWFDPSPVETKIYKAKALPSELAGPGFIYIFFCFVSPHSLLNFSTPSRTLIPLDIDILLSLFIVGPSQWSLLSYSSSLLNTHWIPHNWLQLNYFKFIFNKTGMDRFQDCCKV